MKRLVITGGTGGLGSAIADRFRRDGWAVEAPGRKDLDVRDKQAIRNFFQGRDVDLLVCAAGVTADAPLLKMPESAWDDVMAVNFHGAKHCAAAVLPGMRLRKAGHVIFISSQSAVHPPAGQAAYATAKAALLGLTTALASEHGDAGLRVNAILPGFLETKMTLPVTGKRRSEVLADHALGRFNTPEAVAGFIFHLHEDLPHTSGRIFQLDSRPG